MDEFSEKQKKDLLVLVRFVQLYCRVNHADAETAKQAVVLPDELAAGLKHGVHLCGDCAALVDYAIQKRRKCPLDPKPSCKKCPIHCYSKEYRAKIREVMAFSGKRLILRGRLDLLWHYLF